MAAWRETVAKVSAHAPKLTFGDRSKIAKELWALQKANHRYSNTERALQWAAVIVVIVMSIALVFVSPRSTGPQMSTSVRLRDIQELVRSIAYKPSAR